MNVSPIGVQIVAICFNYQQLLMHIYIYILVVIYYSYERIMDFIGGGGVNQCGMHKINKGHIMHYSCLP